MVQRLNGYWQAIMYETMQAANLGNGIPFNYTTFDNACKAAEEMIAEGKYTPIYDINYIAL